MTTTRRGTPTCDAAPATGLPDDVVARIVVGVVSLRGHLDSGDAISAILAAQTARRSGDTEWPETIDDLAAVLPARRHLWLVEATRLACACCPSGAA